MAHNVTCPLTGVTFDLDTRPAQPYKTVPGRPDLPADVTGVDVLFPIPTQSDPNASAKLARREQALADLPKEA